MVCWVFCFLFCLIGCFFFRACDLCTVNGGIRKTGIYIRASACSFTEHLYAHSSRLLILALFHYSCFPFLSIFLYSSSLSQKAKFWLSVSFWKRKIHGIYYTENQEEYKQYHNLFLQIQMFSSQLLILLWLPFEENSALWAFLTKATWCSYYIHSNTEYRVAFVHITHFWDPTLLSNFPWIPPQ